MGRVGEKGVRRGLGRAYGACGGDVGVRLGLGGEGLGGGVA